MTTTNFQCHLPHSLSVRRSRRSSLRQVEVTEAFRRSDFDGFAKRVTSGEALKEAWRSANEGFEQLLFDAKRAALQFDRRFSVSRRLDSAARFATDRAREIERDFGIGRRWRTYTLDFSRNWPRYRRDLNGFLETPLGKGSTTIFFLWFALSGWLFRFLILATWVLPFAAPLLIGAVANNFVIEGSCPSCKRRFMGYRNQVIQCANCRNIVWKPGNDPSKGASRSNSEPDIIDVEIEEK